MGRVIRMREQGLRFLGVPWLQRPKSKAGHFRLVSYAEGMIIGNSAKPNRLPANA